MLVPALIDCDVGLTEMEKSGASTVTVAVTLASGALVALAVTVIVYVPSFVAVSDQVALAEALTAIFPKDFIVLSPVIKPAGN